MGVSAFSAIDSENRATLVHLNSCTLHGQLDVSIPGSIL